MKKQLTRLLLLLCLFTARQTAFSQQANIWYFGDYAGLDFTWGAPVAISTGALSTNEGCASICDNTGSLLFYTDGISVWDATHTVINPSTPLYGDPSSSQSAIIVPRPGSSNRYYIFTQDEHGWGTCAYGLNYTEVDVTGGVVTLVPGFININLLPCSETTEKITAACHANGTDYWATTVKQNGDFVSWPVTNTGIGAPVTSAVTASPVTGSDDKVGYMKISNQGDHLVLARRQYNSINEIFDYDNSTGKVTANLGVYHVGTVYGVEFSTNGQYFFTTEDFYSVVQYDISSLSTPTTLYTSWPRGALQLGPDGNIYVATGYENTDGNYLDQISNVNTFPATYTASYINLAPGHCRLGLPDVVSCFVPMQDCKVQSKFDVVFNPQSCSYQFTDLSTAGTGTHIVAWQWTFGDGFSSSEQNPTHYYSMPGVYNVCLTVTGYDGRKCCTSKYCTQVVVEMVCPCRIDPAFTWKPDKCQPCTFNFDGFTTYTNREVIAWLWDFGDGTTGSGQHVSHTYAASGAYNVCLTVIGNAGPDGECCTFKICQIVQIDCGKPSGGGNPDRMKVKTSPPAPGKTKAPTGSDLKVYPNPTRSGLHLEFNVPSQQTVKMQLVDYTGKVIWEATQQDAAKGKIMKDVDVSQVTSGFYLLMVEGENFRLVEKVQVLKN